MIYSHSLHHELLVTNKLFAIAGSVNIKRLLSNSIFQLELPNSQLQARTIPTMTKERFKLFQIKYEVDDS